MPVTIRQIMEVQEVLWPIDEENYRRLAEISGTSRTDFLRDHVLKHLAKAVGDLAERCEKRDHKPTIPWGGLTPHAAPIVIMLIPNALQLARIEGLTPEEMEILLEHRLKLQAHVT